MSKFRIDFFTEFGHGGIGLLAKESYTKHNRHVIIADVDTGAKTQINLETCIEAKDEILGCFNLGRGMLAFYSLSQFDYLLYKILCFEKITKSNPTGQLCCKRTAYISAFTSYFNGTLKPLKGCEEVCKFFECPMIYKDKGLSANLYDVSNHGSIMRYIASCFGIYNRIVDTQDFSLYLDLDNAKIFIPARVGSYSDLYMQFGIRDVAEFTKLIFLNGGTI